MAIGVDRLGLLKYGNIEWHGSAYVRKDEQMLTDPANGNHIGTVITYHVSGVVGNESAYFSNDKFLDYLKSELRKPRQLFIHKSDGCGNLAVYGGDSSTGTVLDEQDGVTDIKQKDIANGPTPKSLSVKPLAGKNVAFVEWSVTLTIAHCATSFTLGNRVESITSSYSYSVTDEGLTTRSVDAKVTLMQSLDDGDYETNPDWARAFFSIEQVPGFKRQQQYKIAEDRRSLMVSIVDTEINSRNPYPENVVNIDVRHRVRITTGNQAQLRCTLGGTITLPQGTALAAGFSVILQLVRQRMQKAFITEIEFEEQIWGANAIGFSIQYYQILELVTVDIGDGEMIALPNLANLFEITGLFSPAGLVVDDSLTPYGWEAWQQSMTNVHDERGLRQLEFNEGNDSTGNRVIGGCYTEDPQTQYVADTSIVATSPNPVLWNLEQSTPSECESWVKYQNQLKVKRDSRSNYYGYEQDGVDDSDGEEDPPTDELVYPDHPVDLEEDEFLPSGAHDYRVVMTGGAIRVGHKIPRPKLAAVGSANANELHGEFVHELYGYSANQPIYIASWSIEYKLDKSPGTVGVLSIQPPCPPSEAEEEEA